MAPSSVVLRAQRAAVGSKAAVRVYVTERRVDEVRSHHADARA